ncbi:Outer membrane protein assembly factor BamB [Candidatus Profftia lariciata]|uniref:outer membrane protein assembly factor BamB n=1 Tax=Candidatus Profftia lariciata TaxID=1987921 RepID=UPI001D017237|nr:outer membrane protein assembly factor BamB [Candidatus Profftia lariciata]UDG81749.1 Outer membrane protein assembly factor BamB [Candidatus Profftia lariciata]
MNAILQFFFGCVIILSGCSMFKSDNNIINMSPLPKIKQEFILTKAWSTFISHNDVNKLYFRPSPICYNNIIYVADHFGIVKAININNGATIWSINLAKKNNWLSYQPALLSGMISLSDNKIFIGSERAIVYALNTKDGTKIWQTTVAGEVISRPVISNNLVLIHTTNGMLQALNQANGIIQWTINLDMPSITLRGESSPTIAYGAAIIGNDNGRISAVLLPQGHIIWQQYVTESIGSTDVERINDVDNTPIVINNIVYTLGYNGNLSALDLKSGQIKWQYKISSVNDFIVYEKCIYIVDQDDCIISLSTNNGKFLWQQNHLLHRNLTTPVLYHNYLVLGDSEGYLHALNINNGALILQQRVAKSHLLSVVLSKNDKVIIQTSSNQLYAFTS